MSKFNLIIPTRTPGEYILTNIKNGAVIEIDEELKSIIEKGNIDALNPEISASLEALGVVTPEIDEYRTFKVEYEKRKYRMDSLNFTLVTTYACNLACPYCYEGKGEILHGTMNKNTREKTIFFIKNTLKKTSAKKFSIALYGGEPLLNFDDSVYIMESCFTWADNQGIEYNSLMLTNGTLITPEMASTLHNFNMKSVQITLDGPKSIHDKKRVYKNGKGTFDDIMQSTGILRDYGVPVVFRVNIDAETRLYFGDLLDELEVLGLKKIPVICGVISEGQLCGSYSECIHDADVFTTLAEAQSLVQSKGQAVPAVKTPESSPFFCGFLREGQYLIDPLADIYKCLTFVGLKEHCIGHITEKGDIEYTWAYYDWMSRDPLTIETCKTCKILPSCGGGCAAVAYERYKTYHACGCYNPSSAVAHQVKWYLEKKLPQHFRDGTLPW